MHEAFLSCAKSKQKSWARGNSTSNIYKEKQGRKPILISCLVWLSWQSIYREPSGVGHQLVPQIDSKYISLSHSSFWNVWGWLSDNHTGPCLYINPMRERGSYCTVNTEYWGRRLAMPSKKKKKPLNFCIPWEGIRCYHSLRYQMLYLYSVIICSRC